MAENTPDPKVPVTQPAAHGDGLGLAGNMASAFIQSPLSPIFLIASMAIGLLGLIFTPRQEDPQISVPMVDIFVQYPGASSTQVSLLVADPLERIMSEIPGVEHVYSASRRSQAMVTVQFEVGEEMGPSLVKLYDKLQSNLDRIPPGVSQPLVKPKGIDDVPAVAVTLSSTSLDDNSLRELALDVLQRIKEVPDTGPADIIGGRSSQIRVEITPERLSGYGISLDQIANAIRTANNEVTSGQLDLGGRNFVVLSGRFLTSSSDVEQLVVGIRDGQPVYMSDVANVFQGPEESKMLVKHYTGQSKSDTTPEANGDPAVTITVAKNIGTNGVVVANNVLAKVESLKGYLIPDNVQVTVTRNYGKTANDKVNELLFKLFVATSAVTILVWLTLGSRAAIVVLVVIPVVILVTVFATWVLGFTIDRVSLFALIFSIGILVDDAIVVVENMFRRWLQDGKVSIETGVDAVREVGNPTIIATLTVIAALLPMGFVGDLMGPYMKPIPVLGSVAMAFSLFAAFVFTPWLAYKLRPTMAVLEKMEKKEERTQQAIGKYYGPILRTLLENRLLGYLMLATILIAWGLSCLMFYTTAVTVKMLPLDNKPEFNVVLNMPAGTAMPVTAGLAQQLASELLVNIPEIVDLQVYAGTASPYNFNGMVRHYYLRQEPWFADIQIKLLDKGDRDRSSHEIALVARELLTPIATEFGGLITVAEMPPGPPVLQTLVAEIYGPNDETRRQIASDMTEIFRQSENIVDVDNYMQAPHDIVRFEVDVNKAARHGISAEAINRNLAMAMGGYKLGDVKQGRALEPVHIVLQAPHSLRAIPGRLDNLPITSPDGKSIPLSELGRFYQMRDDPIIYHKDLKSVEYVVGDMTGRLGAPIYGMLAIEDILQEYRTPAGNKLVSHWISAPEDTSRGSFKWDGEWRVTYITFRDMGIAFAAAMLLIYILVVWEFNSFKIPLIIISPIPLTLIGIIPGHWLMGAEFTATSMIGFIALAGIIVRNSILLIDFTQAEIRRGTDVRDAICLSGQIRMRPIMLTALALVAGSSVILFDPIFQGMAVSLLFGSLVATVLTLVVIPMGCDSWSDALCAGISDFPNDGGESSGDEEPEKSGFGIMSVVSIPYYMVRAFLLYLVWPFIERIGAFIGKILSVPYYLLRAFLVYMIWPAIKRPFSSEDNLSTATDLATQTTANTVLREPAPEQAPETRESKTEADTSGTAVDDEVWKPLNGTSSAPPIPTKSRNRKTAKKKSVKKSVKKAVKKASKSTAKPKAKTSKKKASVAKSDTTRKKQSRTRSKSTTPKRGRKE